MIWDKTIRQAFEALTETLYEGDFAIYESGDYVNEIQQYQWEGFHDGWRAACKRGSGWQPIKTAPKGIPIDICGYVNDTFCRKIDVVIEKKSKERPLVSDGRRSLPASHWMLAPEPTTEIKGKHA